MLLILTNREDLTADYLITRLLETGRPYFRLNSEDLSDAEYIFSLDQQEVRRQYANSGRSIDLETVRSVWYRRMLSPTAAHSIGPEQRRFVAGEVRHLIEGLILNPALFWVNPIDATMLAERKVFQLRLAHEIGLRIPPTVISNNPTVLRNFAAQHGGGVICKPVYHGLIAQGSERYAVYTHEVELEDLCDDLQLRSCPTLLQARVPKGTDLRVTFIGREVFPVEIYSTDSMPLDWRRPGEQVQYRPCELSPTLERCCRELLKRLRLSYGAFDFVRAPDGEIFFLEVNPTGEWAWLEHALGLPLRSAFVKLFFHER